MKQLDFVDYAQMGSTLAVAAGNPKGIDFSSLCGAKVAVLKGSYQLTVNVPPLNKDCVAGGDPELQIFQFQDTQQAISSLLSGRTDVVYADSPILGFAVAQEPRIEVSEENDFAPVAIGIPRGAGTRDAVAAAVTAILASPEYQDVLAEYGLQSMAVTAARVNVPQG